MVTKISAPPRSVPDGVPTSEEVGFLSLTLSLSLSLSLSLALSLSISLSLYGEGGGLRYGGYKKIGDRGFNFGGL